MIVMYPVSYERAASCLVDVSLKGSGKTTDVSGNVVSCDAKELSSSLQNHTFARPVGLLKNGAFVPEINAVVKVGHPRTGFLGMQRSDFTVSIQAVPYSAPAGQQTTVTTSAPAQEPSAQPGKAATPVSSPAAPAGTSSPGSNR